MKAWTHNRKAGLRIGRLWIAIGIDKAKGIDYGFQHDWMVYHQAIYTLSH